MLPRRTFPSGVGNRGHQVKSAQSARTDKANTSKGNPILMSASGWDLEALRGAVEARHGQDQRDLLAPCVESISERQFFAAYHFHQGMERVKAFLETRDDRYAHIDLFLGSDEASQEFRTREMEAAAHLTACVQSVHAQSDILGHVLYYALGQNKDPSKVLKDRQISLASVFKQLPPSELRSCLGQLIDHPDYQHLSALANHSKHRSIVPLRFSVDFTDPAGHRHGLRFRAFDHDGQSYPAVWAEDFLTREYSRQSFAIVDAGKELTALVFGSPTSTPS